VASLDRTLALVEVEDVAFRVPDHLHLHVPRVFE
jgi:hypothetical protein